MHRPFLLVAAALLAVVLLTPAGATDNPPARAAIYRVVLLAGERPVGGGTATSTVKGLLTAKHVVDPIGRPYARMAPDGSIDEGLLSAAVVDHDGKRHPIKSWEPRGTADIAVIDAPTLRVSHKLEIAPQPRAGDPLRALGHFSRQHAPGPRLHGPSEGHGWYEGAYEMRAAPGYPYSGRVERSSAPVAPGMSGGALLDSKDRVVGILSFVGGRGIPHSGAASLLDSPAEGG